MAVASAPLPELPCGMHARTLSDSSRDPVPELVTQLYCVVPKRAAVLTLGLADFAHNSATLGSLVDQRLQLSSRIRCSGLLSPEAADFVLELADAGSGLLGAGELVLVGEDGLLRRWVDPE